MLAKNHGEYSMGKRERKRLLIDIRVYPKIQSWIWGYDAYEMVERTYESNPF